METYKERERLVTRILIEFLGALFLIISTQSLAIAAQPQVAAAQTRLALEKMKARLEEMGTSLENMVHMVTYVRGPFPEGTGVVDSPNFRWDVIDDFFKEHCPNFASDKNPPSWDLVGVAGLAHKDMVFEIGCVAVLPDD